MNGGWRVTLDDAAGVTLRTGTMLRRDEHRGESFDDELSPPPVIYAGSGRWPTDTYSDCPFS